MDRVVPPIESVIPQERSPVPSGRPDTPSGTADTKAAPGVPARRSVAWLVLALLALATVILTHQAEAREVARTLAGGERRWILAAVGLQAVFFVLYATLYQTAFRAVGVHTRLRHLLPVWFASLLVNLVAPTLGTLAFVNDAVRRGASGARATAGVVLVKVADLTTFLLVLVVGLAYLFRQHELKTFEVTAALILTGVILAWTSALLLGLWRPVLLKAALEWIQRAVAGVATRFHRPSPLSDEWAERTTQEFADAAAVLTDRRVLLVAPFAVALAAHLIDLASLYVLFLAFHTPVGIGTLVAGFGVGILFWIVGITPEGVGVVESMMTLTFASLGIPAASAASVALAFRGLTLYAPLLVGLAFVRQVRPFAAATPSAEITPS